MCAMSPIPDVLIIGGGASGCTNSAGEPVLERLTLQQVLALEPALTPQIRGALLKRESAQIRSPRLMAALRAVCEQARVEIIENTPVLDLIAGETAGIPI